MDAKFPQARAIYLEAVKHTDPEEQMAFLSEACGNSTHLIERIQNLISVREKNCDNLLNKAIVVSDRNLLGLHGSDKVETSFLDSKITGSKQGGEQEVPLAQGLINSSTTQVIGPYKLREQIGEGGMGIVYVAEQFEPIRRKVALKVVKPGMDTKEVVARFEAERQALAMMSHPNICKVLDGGMTDQGHPYFVMELVKGVPITEFCDKQLLNTHERLELFISVCHAVQHAHMKGIIHRDLKPSNVMVEMHDVYPVPKVIDFGIAKAIHQRLSEHTVYTQFSQLIGTPLYMSPEQAQESSIDIDTRSDIYSLGVMLYELLTGTTPFDKNTLSTVGKTEMRRIICEQDPPRPSLRVTTLEKEGKSEILEKRQASQEQLSISMQRELDWIVMKALEKDRNRRYESASAFAADIQRYLNDEPVEAFPPSTSYLFRKYVRRNKATITTTCLVAAAMIIGTLMSVWMAIEANNALIKVKAQKQIAENATKLALENEEFSHQLVYAADVKLAAQAWKSGDIRRFTDLLDRHGHIASDVDRRGFEWRYLRQFGDADFYDIATETGGSSVVRYSPDGKYLVTGQYDGTVSIRDGKSFDELATLRGHEGLVRGVDFASDGRIMASIGDDGVIRLWDLFARKQIRSFHAHPDHGFRVYYVMDDQVLVSCGEGTSVRLWNAETGESLGELKDYARTVERAAMDRSPDGRLCASGDPDGFAYVWDTKSHKRICKLNLGHLDGARCSACSICFSPDGKFVAIGTNRNLIRICDALSGKQLATFTGHDDDIQAVAFHPSGALLASCDVAGVIRTWPLESHLDLANDETNIKEKWPPYFRGHSSRAWSLDFSPDGTRLVSASRDGTVRSWNERDQSRQDILGTIDTNSIAFVDQENELLLAGDKSIRIWNRKTNELRPFGEKFEETAICVTISPDKKTCVTGHKAGIVRFWNLETGRLEKMLIGHEATIDGISFSPNGKILATASWDGKAKFWDTSTKKQVDVIDVSPHCYDVKFSPNGKLVACSSQNNVMLYDASSRKFLHLLQGHQNTADCVVFSPDSKLLATGSDDRTIRIWDVITGEEKSVIPAHRDAVASVVFSPDGRTVASGGENGTIAFSHVETGQFLFGVKVGKRQVCCLQFSSDGERLAATVDDEYVTLLHARHQIHAIDRTQSNLFSSVSFGGEQDVRIYK